MIRSRLLPALREARAGFLDGWRYGDWHPDPAPAAPPPPRPLSAAELLVEAAFAPLRTVTDWLAEQQDGRGGRR